MKSQHNIQPTSVHERLFSQVIDFFLTHAHPKFVFKLDINNHKTALNKKISTTFSVRAFQLVFKV